MTRVRNLAAAFMVALLTSPLAAQQTGNVTGTVLDVSMRQPLVGVQVSVGDLGSLTNSEGRYLITGVAVGTRELRAQYIGHGTVTTTITVSAGQTTTQDLEMESEALLLEGIVVTGYGQQQEEDLTGVVEEVGVEEFNQGTVVSPEQLIEGKIAGVQIVDSGEPGAGVNIRIRGGTSVTSSNEPLFVLDGVPLPIGGGISAGRNPLNFINPADIESVTVLKDASATAIYGSRGGNGVILITTKKGVTGPAQVSYGVNLTTSRIVNTVDILGADQFRQLVVANAPENTDQLLDFDTDWRAEIEETGYGQEHQFAIAGGSSNGRYRLSGSYIDQEGVITGTQTQRLTAALNFNQVLFDDAVNFTAAVRGSRAEDFFTPGGALGNATSFAPTQPVLDANSEFGGFFEWADPLGPNNPVAEIALQESEGTTYRSVGNVAIDWETWFIPELTATARLAYDVTLTENRFFAPSFERGQAERGDDGTVSRSNSTFVTNVLDLFLNYENDFNGDVHYLSVTGGYSYEEGRADFPSFFAQQLSFDLLGLNGVPSAELERTNISVIENRLISGFARVNYDFRNKYLFNASIRRDGSSRFGPDEQWGWFPSAGIGWRLTGEDFLADSELFSDLKLRASWGVNGNQAFADYQAFSDFLIGGPRAQAQFGDEFVPTVRPSAADPGIKWEETESWNFGVDFGLYDDRITGSVEYYTKETTDLIFTVPVAAGSNLSNFVTTNIGTLENDGWEVTVDWDAVVPDDEDGFRWNANFNFATNNNELVSLNEFGGGEAILTGGIAGGVGNTIQVLQPGAPVNSFFVYEHIRDDAGNPIHADTNGDGNIGDDDLYVDQNGDGIINQDDRIVGKSPAPDWVIGHTSRMGWKSWDLSFTLLSNLGNYVYNNVASNNGHLSGLRGPVPTNRHSSVLETDFDNPQYFSDYYVEDASFLRMDNLSLGYTVRSSHTAIDGTRLFFTVQNVFTTTGYSGIDPTAGIHGIDNNIFPRSRTFGLGASFLF